MRLRVCHMISCFVDIDRLLGELIGHSSSWATRFMCLTPVVVDTLKIELSLSGFARFHLLSVTPFLALTRMKTPASESSPKPDVVLARPVRMVSRSH
jgi:hypothetical protein